MPEVDPRGRVQRIRRNRNLRILNFDYCTQDRIGGSDKISIAATKMPKSLSLFGRYIRQQGRQRQATFRKYQITRVVPNKAAGRVPSAASQMALFHGDDHNSYWRLSAFNTMYRRKLKPFSMQREPHYGSLKEGLGRMRFTPSALYAIDDKGGFDYYIQSTPPEDMRSTTGEILRNLIYKTMEDPSLSLTGIPWRTLARKRNLPDPMYAKYKFALQRAHSVAHREDAHMRYTPYFLPQTLAGLFPQRDEFTNRSAPELDLWWASDPKLEEAFRSRLRTAKSFEEAHPDHTSRGGYRKGHGAGGGGGQGSPRTRSKTYRSRQTRPY